MRPSERSTCSFIPKPLGREFCEGDLSLEKLFKMKIYKTADTSGATIGITIGEVKKYDYDAAGNNYKEITLSDADKTAIKGREGKPAYSAAATPGSRAICDDFVLEY